VDTLARAAAAAPDGALARAPFRRARVLPALFAALAIPARGWCCTEAVRLPPPQRDEADATAGAAAISGVHRAFIEHCGQCHGSANTAPPNFLAGDEAQVRRGIRHCAQRIHFRLAMWERAGHEQAKTPMPPASALQARGVTPQDWRAGAALVSLQAHVRALLDREPGAAADNADALLRVDYARLRSCLPDAAGTRSTATR
jgi:mono/diheme cytochrome c family protein